MLYDVLTTVQPHGHTQMGTHLCSTICVGPFVHLNLVACRNVTPVPVLMKRKKIAILKELQGEIIGYVLIINWSKCLIQNMIVKPQ